MIDTLSGDIEQRPSAVSAIKVDGQRAYDRVRAGDDVVLAARTVTVSRFEVHEIRRTDASIDIDISVDCSSGTYIRALARDLGDALHVGGHLTALRRTHVGPWSVVDACDIATIASDRLISSARIAAELFPTWSMSDNDAVDIGHGKRVRVDLVDAPLAAAIEGQRLRAIVSVSDGVARVVTGFPND